MRIANLLQICGGELKNTPAIQKINDFLCDPLKIKRGDLFIAKEKSAVPEAIQRGAYGVLYEGWIQISDHEIAWIKVDSLQHALLKLFRFLLLQNATPLYILEPFEISLAKLVFQEGVLFLESDFCANIHELRDKKVVLASEKQRAKLALEGNIPQKEKIEIIQPYLFETTCIFDGNYIERARISPLFLPSLEKCLWLVKRYDIPYSLKAVENFKHFKPHFLDDLFDETEFGKSQKVLITEPDPQLAMSERDFLRKMAPWTRHLFLSHNISIEGFTRCNSIDDIREILYNSPWTYALLLDKYPDISYFKKRSREITLF